MRRWQFTFVAALSLLLCAAVCALWAQSYVRGDEVYVLTAGGRGYYAEAGRGAVMYYAARTAVPARPRAEWGYVGHGDTAGQRRAMDDIESRVAARVGNGFRVTGVAFRGGGWLGKDATVALVPLWLPALVLALPPVLWLRQRRRIRPGFCRRCGYDLRATPGRCPECGAATGRATAHGGS